MRDGEPRHALEGARHVSELGERLAGVRQESQGGLVSFGLRDIGAIFDAPTTPPSAFRTGESSGRLNPRAVFVDADRFEVVDTLAPLQAFETLELHPGDRGS